MHSYYTHARGRSRQRLLTCRYPSRSRRNAQSTMQWEFIVVGLPFLAQLSPSVLQQGAELSDSHRLGAEPRRIQACCSAVQALCGSTSFASPPKRKVSTATALLRVAAGIG
jgi:hypothetical protein